VPTSSLHATGHVAGTVSSPTNALGAPNGTWTTDTGNVSWDSRFALDTIPEGEQLDGTQTVTVRARKEAGQSGTPTLAAELWENGSLIGSLFGATGVTTTSQDIAGTFAASAVVDPADVEVRLVGTGAGGSPGARSSVQVDAITWTATYITPAAGLTVVDAAHTHTAATVALIQAHSLTVADMAHAHAAEPVVLDQGHVLTVAGLAHAHAVESVVLTPAAGLTVADVAHAHTVESTVLSQGHVLTVADVTHTHTVGSPAVAQSPTLTVSDSPRTFVRLGVADTIPRPDCHQCGASPPLRHGQPGRRTVPHRHARQPRARGRIVPADSDPPVDGRRDLRRSLVQPRHAGTGPCAHRRRRRSCSHRRGGGVRPAGPAGPSPRGHRPGVAGGNCPRVAPLCHRQGVSR
jgi:hypothetical protein